MSPYKIGSIIKLISTFPTDMIMWIGNAKENKDVINVDFFFCTAGTFGIILDIPKEDKNYKILFEDKIGFVSEQCFMAA
jgi:hypothetical protein